MAAQVVVAVRIASHVPGDGKTVASATTDRDGTYRFERLLPGDYEVVTPRREGKSPLAADR